MAESGVRWSLLQFMFYRWLLEFTKQIFPQKTQKKEKIIHKTLHQNSLLKIFPFGNGLVGYWDDVNLLSELKLFPLISFCDLHPAG